MKVKGGNNGGINPLILQPRHKMEVNGQFHFPAALPPTNKHECPLNRGQCGRFGEEIDITPAGNQPKII